jgi:hypothetical protein
MTKREKQLHRALGKAISIFEYCRADSWEMDCTRKDRIYCNNVFEKYKKLKSKEAKKHGNR